MSIITLKNNYKDLYFLLLQKEKKKDIEKTKTIISGYL